MSTRLVEAFRAVNFREVRMAVLAHWERTRITPKAQSKLGAETDRSANPLSERTTSSVLSAALNVGAMSYRDRDRTAEHRGSRP